MQNFKETLSEETKNLKKSLKKYRKWTIIGVLILGFGISIPFTDYQGKIIGYFKSDNEIQAKYKFAEYEQKTDSINIYIDQLFSIYSKYETLKIQASMCADQNRNGAIVDCKRELEKMEKNMEVKIPRFQIKKIN